MGGREKGEGRGGSWMRTRGSDNDDDNSDSEIRDDDNPHKKQSYHR